MRDTDRDLTSVVLVRAGAAIRDLGDLKGSASPSARPIRRKPR